MRYSTEYIDEKIEFMFEDLDISSIGLLAGHVFIQNITDLEIDAPKGNRRRPLEPSRTSR